MIGFSQTKISRMFLLAECCQFCRIKATRIQNCNWRSHNFGSHVPRSNQPGLRWMQSINKKSSQIRIRLCQSSTLIELLHEQQFSQEFESKFHTLRDHLRYCSWKSSTRSVSSMYGFPSWDVMGMSFQPAISVT